MSVDVHDANGTKSFPVNEKQGVWNVKKIGEENEGEEDEEEKGEENEKEEDPEKTRVPKNTYPVRTEHAAITACTLSPPGSSTLRGSFETLR